MFSIFAIYQNTCSTELYFDFSEVLTLNELIHFNPDFTNYRKRFKNEKDFLAAHKTLRGKAILQTWLLERGVTVSYVDTYMQK